MDKRMFASFLTTVIFDMLLYSGARSSSAYYTTVALQNSLRSINAMLCQFCVLLHVIIL